MTDVTFPDWYPGCQKINSYHQSRGNDDKRTCIINHVMAGRLSYLDRMARSRDGLDGGRKVSVHFGLNEDGEVHQYVKLHNWAWGAGAVTTTDQGIIDLFGIDSRGDRNGNIGSIQVEHPGTSIPLSYAPSIKPWHPVKNPLPQALIDSSIKLQMWLVKNGVVEPVFIGHGDSNPETRPHDPGDEIRAKIMLPLKDWVANDPKVQSLASTTAPLQLAVAPPSVVKNGQDDAIVALEQVTSQLRLEMNEVQSKFKRASSIFQ